jgi:hypothetical protein
LHQRLHEGISGGFLRLLAALTNSIDDGIGGLAPIPPPRRHAAACGDLGLK